MTRFSDVLGFMIYTRYVVISEWVSLVFPVTLNPREISVWNIQLDIFHMFYIL